MLQPKKTKYRKTFRIKHDTHAATKGNRVSFGDFGLQATTSAWVSARQIESARRAITRRMGREGEVFIRIFPHMPKTSKPIGVRMGSGKGSVDQWLAVVRVATMMFEVSGVKDNIAKDALRLGGHKLPLQWKIVASNQKQEEGANVTK